MAPTAETLTLSELHYRQMLDHLLGCLPAEGCGLLGGLPGQLRAQLVLLVPNALNSPLRFRMTPPNSSKPFMRLKSKGLNCWPSFIRTQPAPTTLRPPTWPSLPTRVCSI